LDLDYTPYPHLNAALLRLRHILAPGTAATLEFTAPAQPIAVLGSQFVLCVLPFLPRTHAPARTSTPLFVSLQRVLALLTAGPAAPALERVLNVSERYATALRATATRLEDDRGTRTTFIHQWGAAAWREQRLMLEWEAALFSAGHLTRWIVVVRK
ncbi:hypothetical protein B0H10DRAFT_1658575, partial [Mycena sp. CBHHK59/15]